MLIGASPGLADPAERAERRAADERLADDVSRMTIEEFAARWAQTPVLAGQPPGVAAAVHADRLRNRPAGLAAALRGLGTGALPSLWDRLAEIQVPVTLIVGERDDKFRAIATEMAAALPDSDVAVIPGTGHAVHLEAPERVAALIGGARAAWSTIGLTGPHSHTSSTRRIAVACSQRPLSTSARHRAATSSSASQASTSVFRSVLKMRLSAA